MIWIFILFARLEGPSLCPLSPSEVLDLNAHPHAPQNSCGTFTKDTVIVVGRDRKGSEKGFGLSTIILYSHSHFEYKPFRLKVHMRKSILFVILQFGILGLIALTGPVLAVNPWFLALEIAVLLLGNWAVFTIMIGNFNITPDVKLHS